MIPSVMNVKHAWMHLYYRDPDRGINIVLAEGSFIICMTAAEVQFPTGFLIIMCNVDAHIAEHRYPDLEVH